MRELKLLCNTHMVLSYPLSLIFLIHRMSDSDFEVCNRPYLTLSKWGEGGFRKFLKEVVDIEKRPEKAGQKVSMMIQKFRLI